MDPIREVGQVRLTDSAREVQGGCMFARDRSRSREMRRLLTEEEYDAIVSAAEEDPEVARELGPVNTNGVLRR